MVLGKCQFLGQGGGLIVADSCNSELIIGGEDAIEVAMAAAF
jgi:hypothetical protein